MLTNTQSYLLLRAYIQESLDYAYLTCHAVPALNAYMKAVDEKAAPKIPDPDHFGKPGDFDRLREIRLTYKKSLGRFMVISAFSHFEAYVQDVVREIIDFHGGTAAFLVLAKRRSGVLTRPQRIERFPELKPLNEVRKMGKNGKYMKCVQALEGKGFIFPSQMASAYGIRKLAEAVSKNGFRAARISEIVFDALGLPHDQSMDENIARIREIRNDIAHGRRRKYDLKTSIDDLKLLRQYALAIDQHILTHYMIIENARD